MAMINFQNNASQFNKTMEQLISLLMNQKLMKERLSGYKELEEMRGQRYMDVEGFRQKGDIALQGKRHEDAMTEAQQKFYHDLAQDTKANQLKALAFMGKKEGKDVTPLVGELNNRMKTVSAAVADAFKGVTSPERIESMLNNLTDETLRKVFGVIGDERQRREVSIPSVETQRTTAETSKKRLAYDWAKLGVESIKDQSEEWKGLIKDVEDFLRQEGVKPEEEAMFGKLFEGSGKMPDPLSSENRGKALSWLTKIRMNLIDGIMPSQAERRFLGAVKNTLLIEGREEGIKGSEVIPGTPGEGMPTPETMGYTPTEYGRQQAKAVAGQAKAVAGQAKAVAGQAKAVAGQAKAEKIADIKRRLIESAIRRGKIKEGQELDLDEMFQRKAEEAYVLEELMRER